MLEVEWVKSGTLTLVIIPVMCSWNNQLSSGLGWEDTKSLERKDGEWQPGRADIQT